MSIISLQEIMIVVLAAAVITAYHAHLYIQVRRDSLKTAIGITNHARQMWVNGVIRYYNHAALHYTIGMRGFYLSVPLALWLFGPIWMLAGSLVLIGVLYRLDREA